MQIRTILEEYPWSNKSANNSCHVRSKCIRHRRPAGEGLGLREQ